MATIRRNLKNTVNNYTDIQCKVREATCNEPWGPPASVMTEIADATYSVVDFAEIMSMVWKRLNDSGKNWRHVYKALVVLEYIVKTGSERVAQQCKEQIYSLLTLQDFRFVDKDNKDHGQNVRDKAKQLVALLKDEERLKAERHKSLQAKERFAQNSVGIGSQPAKPPKSGTLGLGMLGRGDRTPDRARPHNSNSSTSDGVPVTGSALEQARPTDRDEEEMQLELALAISKEEAEKDKEERDILRATLERSKTETRIEPKPTLLSMAQQVPPPPSVTLDPWGLPLDPAKTPTNDPWAPSSATSSTQPTRLFPTSSNMPNLLDEPPTYSSIQTCTPPTQPNLLLNDADPWNVSPSQGILQPQSVNPLISASSSSTAIPPTSAIDDFDPFSPVSSPKTTSTVPDIYQAHSSATTLPPSSKMAGILDGQAKHLVNIDNLISAPQPRANTNPFGVPNNNIGTVFTSNPPATPTNPFLGMNATPPQSQPTLNQLRGPPNANMDAPFGHPPVSSSNPFC